MISCKDMQVVQQLRCLPVLEGTGRAVSPDPGGQCSEGLLRVLQAPDGMGSYLRGCSWCSSCASCRFWDQVSLFDLMLVMCCCFMSSV
jgi:hypothetical protein